MVSGQEYRGGSRPRDDIGQGGQQLLASSDVEARGGLVQDEQLRVGHERASDLHPLALPRGESAPGAFGQFARTERVQEGAGALDVEIVVFLAPYADASVGGGEHDTHHELSFQNPARQGRGAQADTGMQLGDVHAPHPLAQNVDRPRGGEQPRRGNA